MGIKKSEKYIIENIIDNKTVIKSNIKLLRLYFINDIIHLKNQGTFLK